MRQFACILLNCWVGGSSAWLRTQSIFRFECILHSDWLFNFAFVVANVWNSWVMNNVPFQCPRIKGLCDLCLQNLWTVLIKFQSRTNSWISFCSVILKFSFNQRRSYAQHDSLPTDSFCLVPVIFLWLLKHCLCLWLHQSSFLSLMLESGKKQISALVKTQLWWHVSWRKHWL